MQVVGICLFLLLIPGNGTKKHKELWFDAWILLGCYRSYLDLGRVLLPPAAGGGVGECAKAMLVAILADR